MAILKSTLVNGDLTVTGSLNVQGNLTYVGVENLRVKDKQIELNTDAEGTAASAGENANQAGIVIRGAQNTTKDPHSEEASILYNYADDTLVVNKTIKGTVASANNAASADKVANKLTVNVTDETGSVKSVEFDGSEVKTVDVNLKGLQDQINSLTGGAGSIATQINNAIKELDVADAAEDGKYVSSVSETDGKITVTRAALPDYTEVYDAKGAAAQALTDAKAYANGLNTDMDGRVDALEGKSHTHANQEELDKIASGDKAKWDGKQDALTETQLAAVDSGITATKVSEYGTHVADTTKHITADERKVWNAKQNALTNTQLNAVNSGVTADKVSGYDAHVVDTIKHITAGERKAWNAAETNANKYTDTKIGELGSAAKKNVLTGTIADSSSEDLVTAAQVKAYAAGVVGAMHFRGAVESTGVITDPASGDICLVGTKEYVYNGTDWVLFGDESAYDIKGTADQALVAAKKYADDLNTAMDGRVDALEAIDHNAYVAADETVLASAKSYANGLAKNYAAAKHSHAIADVTGLDTALAGKAAVDHNHDDVYSKLGHKHVVADITDLSGELAKKQDKIDGAQLQALNSGVTSTTVATYNAHVANKDIHVTTADKDKWNAAEQNAKDYADGKVADLKKTVDTLSNDVLKGVAAGDYVSVSTKSNNSQTISVTTKDVASASDSANGLALAADVKKYVDDKNALQDTEISKIKDGTTLDGRYVNVDGDTMTGKLTMNAADIEMPSNGTNGIVFGGMKIVWNTTDNAIEFVTA